MIGSLDPFIYRFMFSLAEDHLQHASFFQVWSLGFDSGCMCSIHPCLLYSCSKKMTIDTLGIKSSRLSFASKARHQTLYSLYKRFDQHLSICFSKFHRHGRLEEKKSWIGKDQQAIHFFRETLIMMQVRDRHFVYNPSSESRSLFSSGPFSSFFYISSLISYFDISIHCC